MNKSRCSEDSGYDSMIAECGSSYVSDSTSPFKNTIRKAASTTFQVFSNSLRSKTELFYVPPTVEDPPTRTPDGSPSKRLKQGTPVWSSLRHRAQLDKPRQLAEAVTPDGFDSIDFGRPHSTHVERVPPFELPIRTKSPSATKSPRSSTAMLYEIEMDIPMSDLIGPQDPWLTQVGGSIPGSDDGASDMEGHNRRSSDFSVLSQSTQATDRTHPSWKGHSLSMAGCSTKSQRTASPYRMAKNEPRYTAVQALSSTSRTESEIALDMACATQLPCDTAEDSIDGSTDPDDDMEPYIGLGKVHCNGNPPLLLVVPDPVQRLSVDSLAVLCTNDEDSIASGDDVIGPQCPTSSGQQPHGELHYCVEAIERRSGFLLNGVPDDEDSATNRSPKVPRCSERALSNEEVFDEVLNKISTVKEWMETASSDRLYNIKTISECSVATTASCAVTTHSPQCYATPPTPMHHRANPVRSTSEALRKIIPTEADEGPSSSGTDMDVLQSSPTASTSATTPWEIVLKGHLRRNSSATDRRHIRNRSWRMRDSSGQDITYDAVGSPRNPRERSMSMSSAYNQKIQFEDTQISPQSRQYPVRNPSRYRRGDCALPNQGVDLETEASAHSHYGAAYQAYADMVRAELDRLQIARGPAATCMPGFGESEIAFQDFS